MDALVSCLSDPWTDDDFTPCFRETVIGGAVPILILTLSIIFGVKPTIQKFKSLPYGQPLLATHASGSTQYGTLHTDDSMSTSSEEQYEPLPRWSLYNVTRLAASTFQVTLFSYALVTLITGAYDLDPAIEPNRNEVLVAFITQLVYWVYALVLSGTIVLCTDKHVADVLSTHLNLIYVGAFFINSVQARSFYIVHGQQLGSAGYKVALASGVMTLVFLAIIIHEVRYYPLYVKSESGRIESAEKRDSLYSKFMFNYCDPLMEKGNRNTLNEEDLHDLPKESKTKYMLKDYSNHKHTSFRWSLLKTFQAPLLQQFVYTITRICVTFGPPFALNKIVKFIEQPSSDAGLTPYFYAVAMLVFTAIQLFAQQQSLHIGRKMCVKMQSIVIGEVYSKALRLRQQNTPTEADGNESTESAANINNLVSVDANKMGDIVVHLSFVYGEGLGLIISLVALYYLLGTAALYGAAIMVLSQPLFYKLSDSLIFLDNDIMKFTDKRMGLMNELLNAIRIVKFFAWEGEFRKRIGEVRDKELKATRRKLIWTMWLETTGYLLTPFIMITMFSIYASSNVFKPSTAFTALALFNIFKIFLDNFPYMLMILTRSYVSLKRVEKFLEEEEEVDPIAPVVSMENETIIGFVNNASFTWSAKSTTPVLKNLNLAFPPQKLSIVCGPTGSGKTMLLASLLGETHRHTGAAVLPRSHTLLSPNRGGAVSGIAYVAQTAWIQSCSIRDNILFGSPYDQERYEKVIYMTALLPDLEVLEHGDQTEVGERGITLSGGQKQRIAIARAVYSQAKTIVFDDCLSAVDAHTAKHLYEECITSEFLQDCTIILVTHHVNLCIQDAAYVVVLNGGEVVAKGSPRDVVAAGALGDEVTLSDDEDATAAVTPDNEKEPSSEKKDSPKAKSDGGKLIKAENRAVGGVSWKVYAAYFYASGGLFFWIGVAILFVISQGAVVGQDVWIKIWSTASSASSNETYVNPSVSYMPLINDYMTIKAPAHTLVLNQESDDFSPYATASLTYYVLWYIIISVIAMLLYTLRLFIVFIGSLRASRSLHAKLLNSVLSAKIRFFDTTPVGQIINRFSSDMETVDQSMGENLASLLYAIIAVVFTMMLITYIIPIFLFPGAIISIVLWKVSVYYLNASRDLKRLNSVTRSPIYVQFHESISGVATIRAFGCQRRFTEENHQKVDTYNMPYLWMWTVNRWLNIRMELFGAAISFITSVGLLLSRSSIDAGLAGLALSTSLTFTMSIIYAVRIYADYELNCNSVERIQEYLAIEKEPEAHTNAHLRPTWPESGSVKVDQLVMKYAPETPPVLHSISFETRPQEKVGIVGRTGSGKSTLALSLFRFTEATSGSIAIDGVDVSKISLHDLRSRLTIIPQDPVLFSGTLRSNLDPFQEFTDADLYAALKRSHLIGGDDNITLDSHVAENGNNWSQGQRQLIALARALVKKSALIVLDEATSSVDFDTDQRIQETIRTELFADSSILCIAHRLRTVIDYDRILVLDQGRIVEFDTPYALMTREDGLFYQMCERSGEFAELFSVAQQKSNRSM